MKFNFQIVITRQLKFLYYSLRYYVNDEDVLIATEDGIFLIKASGYNAFVQGQLLKSYWTYFHYAMWALDLYDENIHAFFFWTAFKVKISVFSSFNCLLWTVILIHG